MPDTNKTPIYDEVRNHLGIDPTEVAESVTSTEKPVLVLADEADS